MKALNRSQQQALGGIGLALILAGVVWLLTVRAPRKATIAGPSLLKLAEPITAAEERRMRLWNLPGGIGFGPDNRSVFELNSTETLVAERTADGCRFVRETQKGTAAQRKVLYQWAAGGRECRPMAYYLISPDHRWALLRESNSLDGNPSRHRQAKPGPMTVRALRLEGESREIKWQVPVRGSSLGERVEWRADSQGWRIWRNAEGRDSGQYVSEGVLAKPGGLAETKLVSDSSKLPVALGSIPGGTSIAIDPAALLGGGYRAQTWLGGFQTTLSKQESLSGRKLGLIEYQESDYRVERLRSVALPNTKEGLSLLLSPNGKYVAWVEHQAGPPPMPVTELEFLWRDITRKPLKQRVEQPGRLLLWLAAVDGGPAKLLGSFAYANQTATDKTRTDEILWIRWASDSAHLILQHNVEIRRLTPQARSRSPLPGERERHYYRLRVVA